MRKNGFLELTAATVFGLVMLAASAVGVLLGSIAVQRKTPPPPKAEETCISLTVSEDHFGSYENSYSFTATVANVHGSDTQISAFIQENSQYVTNYNGGLGVQTIGNGESRSTTFTVYMDDNLVDDPDNPDPQVTIRKWTELAKRNGTTTSVKVYATSRNIGDWGCYEDEVQTITFGTTAEVTPTLTPTLTPTTISGTLTLEHPGNAETEVIFEICSLLPDESERNCNEFKDTQRITVNTSGNYGYQFNNLTTGKRYGILAAAIRKQDNVKFRNLGPEICPNAVIGYYKDICKATAPATQNLLIRIPSPTPTLTPTPTPTDTLSGILNVDNPSARQATSKVRVCKLKPDESDWDCGAFTATQDFVTSTTGGHQYRFDNLVNGGRYGVNAVAYFPDGTNVKNLGSEVCPGNVVGLYNDVCKVTIPTVQNLKLNIPTPTATLTPTLTPTPGNLPDLTCSDSDIELDSTNPTVGQNVKFRFTYYNRGTATPPQNSSGQVFLDDQSIYEGTITNLNPGESRRKKWFPPNGWTATAGSHTIEVKLDTQNIIEESNEKNNECSRTFTIDSCKTISDDWVCWTAGIACPGTTQAAPDGTCYDADGNSSNACCNPTAAQPGTISGTVRVNANGLTYTGVNVGIWRLGEQKHQQGITWWEKGESVGPVDITIPISLPTNQDQVITYNKSGLTDLKYILLANVNAPLPGWPNWYKNSDYSIDCPDSESGPTAYHCIVTTGSTQNFTITLPVIDLNGDGTVDALDWSILVNGWNEGIYDALDASLVLHAWAAQAGI